MSAHVKMFREYHERKLFSTRYDYRGKIPAFVVRNVPTVVPVAVPETRTVERQQTSLMVINPEPVPKIAPSQETAVKSMATTHTSTPVPRHALYHVFPEISTPATPQLAQTPDAHSRKISVKEVPVQPTLKALPSPVLKPVMKPVLSPTLKPVSISPTAVYSRIPDFDFDAISRKISPASWFGTYQPRKKDETGAMVWDSKMDEWLDGPDGFFATLAMLANSVYGKRIHPDDSHKAMKIQELLQKGYEFVSGPHTVKPIIRRGNAYVTNRIGAIGSGMYVYDAERGEFVSGNRSKISLPSLTTAEEKEFRVDADFSYLSGVIQRKSDYDYHGLTLITNTAGALIIPESDPEIGYISPGDSVFYAHHRINPQEAKKRGISAAIMSYAKKALDP